MIAPKFLDPLILEDLGDRWRSFMEFRVDSAVLRCRLVIPAGTISDLSSVPRISWVYALLGDRGRKAGFIHDFVYTHHLAGDPTMSDRARRALADAAFYEALILQDVDPVRAWCMYAGVRLGGWTRW